MTAFKSIDAEQEQAMHKVKTNRNMRAIYFFLIAFGVSCLGMSGCGQSMEHPKQMGFASPDAAAAAFAKAVREDNQEEMLKILGPEGKDLIWSGDEVSDQHGRDMFEKAYNEQHKIDAEGDKEILVIGKKDWPFPIPIIQENKKWIFDTNSGREEILNRRIGRNELDTIQTILAIVDAQREYAMKDYDGDGIHQYARRFMSEPGKKNGLYWETKDGQPPSPLGPLVAEARAEGYLEKKSAGKHSPYHGYFYRILTAQGEHADGGAIDYVVKGEMIGGFAVVAYPAEYGNSGIMTFMVNYEGVIYQKDLGEDTEQKAKAMEKFDPDETWSKVKSTD